MNEIGHIVLTLNIRGWMIYLVLIYMAISLPIQIYETCQNYTYKRAKLERLKLENLKKEMEMKYGR